MKILITILLLFPSLSLACEIPDTVTIANGADYAITVARDYPITESDIKIQPYQKIIYKNPQPRLTFERHIYGADPSEFDICGAEVNYPEAVIFTPQGMYYSTNEKLSETNLRDIKSIEKESYLRIIQLD